MDNVLSGLAIQDSSCRGGSVCLSVMPGARACSCDRILYQGEEGKEGRVNLRVSVNLVYGLSSLMYSYFVKMSTEECLYVQSE